MNLYCSVESPQSNRSDWPGFQRPSCSAQHSRSSSTSTVVDPHIAYPVSPQPPATSAVPMQFSSHMQLKPAATVPSSPQHPLKQGVTPRLLPHDSTRMDRAVYESSEKPLDGEDCVFDMDSEERPFALPMLDRSALSYESTGKPQPWTVRRMSLYDSLQAQIRAIDDDDNEFYLS
ncbi:hypothetical protein EV183_001068 [Coemansia sp. RSA 2336]|nr:hypothetical protein EV183_001068 [Coemansia sp. RSA 2336]